MFDVLCRTMALLQQCNLPTTPPPDMTPQDFMRLMAVDKKAQEGQIRLILLKGALGSCVVTGDFDHEKLSETLQHFCSAQ